jgi:methylamine--corrinoid protein Co-methyltransferase
LFKEYVMIRNYLEIARRAETGPRVDKSDWDFDYIVEMTQEVVDKYQLSWDADTLTPDDPDLADRIFDAGRDLVIKTGVYALSTGRIIQLDVAEVDEGIRGMRTDLVMGEGKDARTLFARDIMDPRLPLVWAGNPGAPIPETLFIPSVRSWAQEPIVDLITCGSLAEVDGFPVKSADVSEIFAVKRELEYLRQCRQMVGRPGMGMLAAQSSVSEIGDLAAAHPDYLRPCDAHLVAMFNELMIDRGNMIRAAHSESYRMRNASLACVMVGGLGGDAPGAAVVQVASFIAANIVCRADYHLCHPIHINHVATSTRGCMWLQSVVCQAFARNAPAIIVCDIYPKSGALTKELLYEVAANALAVTVSGGHLEGVGSADGNAPNGTGLEVRLMGEVGHAAARLGLTLADANRMINALLAKYEFVFDKAGGNPGQCIDTAYDLEKMSPVPEWQGMYEEVIDELVELGLEIAR